MRGFDIPREEAELEFEHHDMGALFNGQIYPHRMIAERQREVAVSLKALWMMQDHHGNRYLSFKCISHEEEAEWYRKAEDLVPQVGEVR